MVEKYNCAYSIYVDTYDTYAGPRVARVNEKNNEKHKRKKKTGREREKQKDEEKVHKRGKCYNEENIISTQRKSMGGWNI